LSKAGIINKSGS